MFSKVRNPTQHEGVMLFAVLSSSHPNEIIQYCRVISLSLFLLLAAESCNHDKSPTVLSSISSRT